MILKIVGKCDEYEIESLGRMIFPDLKIVDDENDSNSLFVSNVEGVCEVELIQDGKREFLKEQNVSDGEETKVLSKMMLRCYKNLCGKELKWGILTGIRPIKFYRSLIAKGFSNDEIVGIMEDKWGVTPNISQFALSIAKTQINEINKLSHNGVSVYIGVPFCPTRCSYCTFVSQSTKTGSKIIEDYLNALVVEIEEIGKTIKNNSLKVDSVYIGGGTPTILDEPQLLRLLKKINYEFPMENCLEFTVEGGRPDTLSDEKLQIMKNEKVTRVSVNPQTMVQSVLDGVGRIHTVGEIEEKCKKAMDMGFIVNMDLIAGLPNDSLDGFCYSLDKVISLNPHNITVHSLTVKRGSKIYENDKLSPFDKDELIEKMIDYSRKKLKESGFNPYYLYRNKGTVANLDNTGYERDNTSCIYNISMMEEVQSVISAGAGSVTRLNKGERLSRVFSLKLPLEYIKNPSRIIENQKKVGEFYENDYSNGEQPR